MPYSFLPEVVLLDGGDAVDLEFGELGRKVGPVPAPPDQVLPAEEVPPSSSGHVNHCTSHLVKFAWKSENVVQIEVGHRNNLEARLLGQFFLQRRLES